MARALSRLSLGRGGPRDLAAHPRRARRRRRRSRGRLARARDAAGRARAAPRRRSRGPIRRSLRELAGRARPTSCRCSSATAASSAPGYDAELDETRALRDERRRVIAALQARYADETGVRVAEDPAQQRARLFRRGDGAARREAAGGAAQRDLHPPPDDGQRRCASPPPSWPSSKRKIASAADRALGIELEIFDALVGRGRSPRADAIQAAAEALAVLDVAAALADARGRARLCAAARSTTALAFAIEGGRHPVVEQALQRDGGRSSPTTATCRRRRGETPAASGCSPARTWPASRPSCARTR